MYLQCATEESSKRQRQFEMILLEMMGQQSYSQITVGLLCQKAGVSRSAFYHYFDSKDDVLSALIDHTLLNHYLLQTEHRGDLQAYREKLRLFLCYWMEQKPLLDALQRNAMDGKLLQRCMEHTARRFFDERYAPFLGEEETRRQLTLFAVTGIFTLILEWHHKGYCKTVDQMMEVMERVMLRPLIVFPE